MGFKRTKTYRLQWAEDHDLHGLDVSVRNMRMGELMALGATFDEAKEKQGSGFTAIDGLVTQFSGVLMQWNHEDDDGNTLPTTPDGIKQLEMDVFMGIVEAFMEAATGVSEDLGKDSPNGGLSQVQLPPMDEL